MGSPPEEAGRDHWEGPQRGMRIPSGFWLFNTPCTQELWEAVMEENPSYFRSPTRPVEQVDWEDCQAFVKRLNSHLEGLELSLPSEAQWEYACRAGTMQATYAGNLETQGMHNAQLLDGIAWYGRNSSVDYELAVGHDISSLPERHDLKTGGTHPVGRKAANAWGLYDMLGNVWEWCMDSYRNHGDTSERPAPVSAARVIRGGAWNLETRYIRAATRIGFAPGSRVKILGFRCGEFQAGHLSEG
jgi:formylglycine-generating enzyme required for sulfatase activity